MPSSLKLLVPVALDVLSYRTAEGALAWAQTASTLSQQSLQPPSPFALLGGDRQLGAYLHWALPDGLTRAVQGNPASGALPSDLTFPWLPDRWAVVRLSAGAAGTGPGSRLVSAWMLDTAGQPLFSTPGAMPLTTWAASAHPPPAGQTPVTALGPGDPSWAAYYDNVTNRFAFYDSLDGATGPIAYLVCGWYADPAQDLLAAARTSAALDDLMEAAGWQLPDDGSAGQVPVGCVFHGTAVSIAWPGMTWPGDLGGQLSAEVDQRPDPAAALLSLAPTVAQALATLAGSAGEPAQTVTAIQAFLQQAQTEAYGPDAAARLAGALHAAGFTAASPPATSATIWQAPVTSPPMPPVQVGLSSGQLADVLALAGLAAGPEVPTQGSAMAPVLDVPVPVARPASRRFAGADPVLVLQGAGRSAKHGGDGRFTAAGQLRCRLSGQTVTSLGPAADGSTAPAAVLSYPGGWPFGSQASVPEFLPAELADLVTELAALDPGSAGPPASAAAQPPALIRTVWWATWDPTAPPPPLEVTGLLPSPVALTPPTRPWTPLHLDWQVSWVPAATTSGTWTLGDTDLVPAAPGAPPASGPAQAVTGRTLVTGGPATVLAGAIAAAQRVDLSEVPANADLLAATLDGLSAQVSDAGPPGLRAGRLQLARARLVDTYGQHVDLVGDGTAGVKVLTPPAADGSDTPGVLAQPPRLSQPARAQLRYTAADDRHGPDGGPVEADDAVSPLCGFLITDLADGSLEIATAGGQAAGRLRPDPVSGCAWETPPGSAAVLGADPAAALLGSAPLSGLATGLLAVDTAAAAGGSGVTPAGTALAGLLCTLDTVSLTVALTSSAGDEHLALLLGQPVAVLRAALTVELDLPAGSTPPVTSLPVQVRLGALDRLEDGLLGYFVDDDYSRLRLLDPAVADLSCLAPPGKTGQAASAYLDTSPLYVQPGRTVMLTLLAAPGSAVHITTGLLPVKSIGMRRGWVAPGLSALTPSLRYGPLLVDPVDPVLPMPSDIPGKWTRLFRPDPASWATDVPTPDPGGVALPARAPEVSEGWLRVALQQTSWNATTPIEVTVDSVSQIGRDTDNPGWPAGQLLFVGGHNPDGAAWALRAEEVAALISTGRYQFDMVTAPALGGAPGGPGIQPVVLSAAEANGSQTVRALASPTGPDLLPGLPECPSGGMPLSYWTPDGPPLAADGTPRWDRFTFGARSRGLLLDVTTDGWVQQSAGDGTTVQEWQLAWVEKGYAQVISWDSGLCLQAGTGQLTVAQAQPGLRTQHWLPVATGDGYLVLYNRDQGQCLSVQGGSQATAGAAAVLAGYTGDSSQQWTAQPVAAGDPNATVLSVAIAQPAYTGQVAQVTVIARNTGDNIWQPAGTQAAIIPAPVFLGSGVTAIQAPAPSVVPVAPGQQATYTGIVALPFASSASVLAIMSAGKTAVGTPLLSLTVPLSALTITQRSATLTVSPAPPSTMTAGDTATLTVTITNTGSLPWYSGAGYQAFLMGTGGTDWGIPPLSPLPATGIAAGAAISWQVNITAASPVGSKNLGFVMMQSGTAFAAASYVINVITPKDRAKESTDKSSKDQQDKIKESGGKEKDNTVHDRMPLAPGPGGPTAQPPGPEGFRESFITGEQRPFVGGPLYDPPEPAGGDEGQAPPR